MLFRRHKIFKHYLKVNIQLFSDLYLPKEVQILNDIPEPLEFYRNWVAPNIPFVIKGGINSWPAVKKWNKEYFTQVLKDKKISVAVTPNGYADAITKTTINGKPTECFVLPEERLITLSDFLTKLEEGENFSDHTVKESKGIFYIQKQNSNLTEEFPELLTDVDENLLWASDTFNSKPSAINLWIGDERAVTSLHKDPFENIYCVVSGYKEFTLLPPTDRLWLPYKTFPVGQYKETEPGNFDINLFHSDKWMTKGDQDSNNAENDLDSDTVPWIDIDLSNPDYDKYPLYKNASPIKVVIEKGDILYLPSLWFHYVKQSHGCIALNYWYDMNLDIKYAYFQLLENLMKCCELS